MLQFVQPLFAALFGAAMSVLGFVHTIQLCPAPAIWHQVMAITPSLGLVLACLAFHTQPAEVRVATFNIENFPRDERQIAGAFEAIEALDAPVVAVQEITEPRVFADEARARLGDDWRFVHAGGDAPLRVGVLYDGARYSLAWARTRGEASLGGRHRPALEVRLRSREGGRALRVIVVHLKAGGEHAATRREQLRQLEPVLADAAESWDELVILGDFNATPDEESVAMYRRAGFVHAIDRTVPTDATATHSSGRAIDFIQRR